MGQEHHIHTKSDPKSLRVAEDTFDSFVLWARNIVIITAIILSVMALTLV